MPNSSRSKIDPKLLERAKKLQEKEKKRTEKRTEKYVEEYGVKKGSEEYDEVLKRYSYKKDCVKCGAEFRAYAQDFHQFQGKCASCRKVAQKEARKARRKEEREALKELKALKAEK